MQKTVKTYDELRQWVIAFNSGTFEVFIIEGSPGVGKSQLVTRTLTEKYRLIEGRTSAVCLYEELKDYRDQLFVVDDVDDIYRDKAAVNLLKCLCQTTETKRVVWNTFSQKRGQSETEFFTKSKVAIIANRWEAFNKHIGAVEDRGLLVHFKPDAGEVHRYVATINASTPLCDKEVYDAIGELCPLIADPSIRHYRNAQKIKESNMPWRETLTETLEIPETTIVVLQLLKDCALSQNARSHKFAEITGKSARTYMRILEELRSKNVVAI